MSRLVVVALVCVWGSGCSFTSLQIKKDQVGTVRRVAIVGYEGRLFLDDGRPKNVVTASVAAVKNSNDLRSGKRALRRQEQAAAAYDELARKLIEGFGWEVVDRQSLGNVPLYRQRVEHRPDSFLGDNQYLRSVLTQSELNGLPAEERVAIARALGVDALVMVDVNYSVGKTGGVTVGGMGSTTRFPEASAHFKMLDASGKLIWEDSNAWGEVTTEALRTTMGADVVDNETQVLTQAASSAFDAVLARYRTYQPPPAK